MKEYGQARIVFPLHLDNALYQLKTIQDTRSDMRDAIANMSECMRGMKACKAVTFEYDLGQVLIHHFSSAICRLFLDAEEEHDESPDFDRVFDFLAKHVKKLRGEVVHARPKAIVDRKSNPKYFPKSKAARVYVTKMLDT